MLDKQINLFGISTTAFLNEKEKEINKVLIDKKKELIKLKQTINDLEKMAKKYKGQTDNEFTKVADILELIEKEKIDYGLLEDDIKQTKKNVKKLLKEEFAEQLKYNQNNDNKIIRELDLSYVEYTDKFGEKKPNLTNIISMFSSELSRSFGIKTNELTEKIIIIDMYYYDLAQDLLVNGFNHRGKHYVYFSSSAGQIRTKKGVWVEENSYENVKNRLTCGLSVDDINKCGGVNINKYLAYTALCASATETWVDIFNKTFDIDRCIVVDDFNTNVIGVADYIDCDTYEIFENKKDGFSIDHMDGAGLISLNYSNKNFMFRMPYFKGLLCAFDFNRFCSENNCSKVKDIWGKEYDIFDDNIEIIFTKSQMKLNKQYFESWEHYKTNFKKYGSNASICNIETDTNKFAKINYQMLQNLVDMSNDEVVSICKKSNNKIEKINDSLENMLSIFGIKKGVTVAHNNKSYFTRALQLYPELIGDISNKDMLRDLKNSLVKQYKGGRLEINGMYQFVVPDLYAFCEWLFLGVENPIGLLDDGEVFSKIYKNNKELDCLRSPALYKEHCIRNNVYNKKYRGEYLNDWFTTKAIYISVHDLISRVLQLDVDGDTLLVVAQKDIIEIAKKNMLGVNPLYYKAGKAKAQELNKNNIWKGLETSFSGGSIGIISNTITKVWNKSEINQKDLDNIKRLVMQNNQVIDRAKTLWQTTPPNNIDVELKKCASPKVPYFFQFAKNKTMEQCEDINDSTMNKICANIIDKPLRFDVIKNMDSIDYKMFTNSDNIYKNKKINDLYNSLNRKTARLLEKEQFFQQTKIDIEEEFNNLNYSRESIASSLAYFLYHKPTIRKKRMLWLVYGDILLKNLENNINKETVCCDICGRRDNIKNIHNGKCIHCVNKKKTNDKINQFKTINCIDCGEPLKLSLNNTKTIRCAECQKVKTREKDRERKRNEKS